MPFKFVANICQLFTEHKFIDRFEAAKQAGFDYVEITSDLGMIGYSPEELSEAQERADIKVALINVCTGRSDNGEFGLAADPGKQESFKQDLTMALKYAKSLKCEHVHILAGLKGHLCLEDMEVTYRNNLKHAAAEFESIGTVCQIEFICTQTKPGYFLNSASQAIKVLNEINHPNLLLQLDIYHLQMTEGNLTECIKQYLPYTSYIQVSQAPSRNEPNSPGEIDYQYVFQLLEHLDYHGYIGLEYSPSTTTLASFSWLKDWNLSQ